MAQARPHPQASARSLRPLGVEASGANSQDGKRRLWEGSFWAEGKVVPISRSSPSKSDFEANQNSTFRSDGDRIQKTEVKCLTVRRYSTAAMKKPNTTASSAPHLNGLTLDVVRPRVCVALNYVPWT